MTHVPHRLVSLERPIDLRFEPLPRHPELRGHRLNLPGDRSGNATFNNNCTGTLGQPIVHGVGADTTCGLLHYGVKDASPVTMPSSIVAVSNGFAVMAQIPARADCSRRTLARF